MIVPKFAQNPVAGGGPGHADYQRAICDVFDENYEEQLAAYNAAVQDGKGAAPFVMRVLRQLSEQDRFPGSDVWACVTVERVMLEINDLQTVTREVVEAAREILVIGSP